LLKPFPPEARPRQREVLIEIYRKGKIAEAFRAFTKIYLKVVGQLTGHLETWEFRRLEAKADTGTFL
jgi:hypothetical protein